MTKNAHQANVFMRNALEGISNRIEERFLSMPLNPEFFPERFELNDDFQIWKFVSHFKISRSSLNNFIP